MFAGDAVGIPQLGAANEASRVDDAATTAVRALVAQVGRVSQRGSGDIASRGRGDPASASLRADRGAKSRAARYRFALVVPQQAAEPVGAADAADFALLHQSARIRPWRDDADPVGHLMIELRIDGEQPRPVIRAQDDAVAAEPAAEDADLGFQEADVCVATGRPGFAKEAQDGVEPAETGREPHAGESLLSAYAAAQARRSSVVRHGPTPRADIESRSTCSTPAAKTATATAGDGVSEHATRAGACGGSGARAPRPRAQGCGRVTLVRWRRRLSVGDAGGRADFSVVGTLVVRSRSQISPTSAGRPKSRTVTIRPPDHRWLGEERSFASGPPTEPDRF